MAKMKVRLTFPEVLINEPVIFNLSRKFQVVTNIKRANVEEKVGWVILELTGETDEIDKGIAWLKEIGVRVDPVEADIVEG
ncbi:MAG: NIL domain-containing protein [Actinomycetota bacterium]